MPALANTSRDSDSERSAKVASKNHSIETHCPEDHNCEVCKKTKCTRALCRRRTGEPVLRADKFGALITDHKVLNEGAESRNNHRHAVVVQDLATQWIQSYPWYSDTTQRKKVPLQYCCNQAWMKSGGQILWNAIPICETFKFSCLMGQLHTKGVLENRLRDQSFRLVHWLSITPFLLTTCRD